MDLILYALQHDFFVILPIVLASILLVSVVINRWVYFKANERDMDAFTGRLQRELAKGNLDNAMAISEQLGGDIGRVTEEGLQLIAQQRLAFDRSFDITIALAVRRLEKGLTTLGTIGTVAPYLGLFATVVRILLTFGELSAAGGNTAGAPQIMFGIGSALIATALGLAVAILAVVANNYFRAVVARFENDFKLLKLVLMSAQDVLFGDKAPASANSPFDTQQRQASSVAPSGFAAPASF
jgi:biopolymer transport protein ExbB